MRSIKASKFFTIETQSVHYNAIDAVTEIHYTAKAIRHNLTDVINTQLVKIEVYSKLDKDGIQIWWATGLIVKSPVIHTALP